MVTIVALRSPLCPLHRVHHPLTAPSIATTAPSTSIALTPPPPSPPTPPPPNPSFSVITIFSLSSMPPRPFTRFKSGSTSSAPSRIESGIPLRRVYKSWSSLILSLSFAAKHIGLLLLRSEPHQNLHLLHLTGGPSLPTTSISTPSYAPSLSPTPSPSAQSSPSSSTSTRSPSRSTRISGAQVKAGGGGRGGEGRGADEAPGSEHEGVRRP